MVVANGSAILAADLAALVTAGLAVLQADNGQLPGGHELHFHWQEVVAGTLAASRTIEFVTPVDLLVEAIAVETGDHTAASTTTVTITGDGSIRDWPISISGTTGAGITKIARLPFDGFKTKGRDDEAINSRAFRCWPKGSTITIVVATTSVAVASMIHVVVTAREFLARI